MATTQKGWQRSLKLIVSIASMATTAVDAINTLWKLLNEDGRLSDGMRRLLDALRRAATIRDPVEKHRQSLTGLDAYLREQHDMPDELSDQLRGRIRDCQRKLVLAASLEGAARRRVLKGVKAEVSDLVKQVLTLGSQAGPSTLTEPSDSEGSGVRKGLPHWPSLRHQVADPAD